MGIEPTSSAWKAEVLPLNYTRKILARGFTRFRHPLIKSWWRGQDSNLRRLSRQIYSLLPLTAWVPLRNSSRPFCKIMTAVSIQDVVYSDDLLHDIVLLSLSKSPIADRIPDLSRLCPPVYLTGDYIIQLIHKPSSHLSRAAGSRLATLISTGRD